jgi:hypothetical protein
MERKLLSRRTLAALVAAFGVVLTSCSTPEPAATNDVPIAGPPTPQVQVLRTLDRGEAAAISVYVNPRNPIECLSLQQLEAIFAEASPQTKTWRDVDATRHKRRTRIALYADPNILPEFRAIVFSAGHYKASLHTEKNADAVVRQVALHPNAIGISQGPRPEQTIKQIKVSDVNGRCIDVRRPDLYPLAFKELNPYAPEKRPFGNLIGSLLGGTNSSVRTAELNSPKFPWPPPAPSDRSTITRDLLLKNLEHPTLQQVADRLAAALRQAEYQEYSFYDAPGGFVLVARIERIDEDGHALPQAERYAAPTPRAVANTLTSYIASLFFAQPGRYRMIAFAVTDNSFVASRATLSASGASSLLSGGASKLAPEFTEKAFGDGYQVDALIYEFFSLEEQNKVVQLVPGRLGAQLNLERSGILAALQKLSVAGGSP